MVAHQDDPAMVIFHHFIFENGFDLVVGADFNFLAPGSIPSRDINEIVPDDGSWNDRGSSKGKIRFPKHLSVLGGNANDTILGALNVLRHAVNFGGDD